MSKVIYVLMEGDTILRKTGSSVGTQPAIYMTRRAARQALETGKAWGSYPAHARLVTFGPVDEESMKVSTLDGQTYHVVKATD